MTAIQTPSAVNLTLIGAIIREAGATARTVDNIRQMHSTPAGAEILRLIVRDDLGGAANIIANALWDAL